MFKFEIDPIGHDLTGEEEFEPAVCVKCENCSTLHDLSNNAEFINKKKCPMLGDECDRSDEHIGELLCDGCRFIGDDTPY